MDAESESDKKKAVKKSTIDGDNENAEGKVSESGEGGAADIETEADDDMHIDKTSDNEDDETKGDDKDKRKKFVRLFCVHCRIESATFKVRTTIELTNFPMISKYYNNHIRRIITTIFIAAVISWYLAVMDWSKKLD